MIDKIFLLTLCTLTTLCATHRESQVENEQVKVWKTTIMPHQPLNMHRHDRNRVVVTLKGGTLTKIEETGETSELVFEEGKAYWLESDPPGTRHADINDSSEPVEVMVIEIKNNLEEKTKQAASQGYDETFVGLVEMIYGKGFLSQGGPESVQKMIDIESGLGGPALHVAKQTRANVTGLEPQKWMVEIANRNLNEMEEHLQGTVNFLHLVLQQLIFHR